MDRFEQNEGSERQTSIYNRIGTFNWTPVSAINVRDNSYWQWADVDVRSGA